MKFKATDNRPMGPQQVTARCPHCGKTVILEALAQDIVLSASILAGQRRCPDPLCHGHIFIVTQHGQILAAYPGVRIDFDSTDIPPQVLKPFEEALDCHAPGYFTASAIMIRRTLEAICDERSAQGKDFKDRIKALSGNVIIPTELLDGMDELRILGNDAAHVHAAAFATISNEELQIAIEFAKEVLKALYQYSALLGKLRGLKSSGSA
jgi:hypothetical protein